MECLTRPQRKLQTRTLRSGRSAVFRSHPIPLTPQSSQHLQLPGWVRRAARRAIGTRLAFIEHRLRRATQAAERRPPTTPVGRPVGQGRPGIDLPRSPGGPSSAKLPSVPADPNNLTCRTPFVSDPPTPQEGRSIFALPHPRRSIPRNLDCRAGVRDNAPGGNAHDGSRMAGVRRSAGDVGIPPGESQRPETKAIRGELLSSIRSPLVAGGELGLN